MMMIPAPEISNGTDPALVLWKAKVRRIGEIAMNARKFAPNRVSLFAVLAMYAEVCVPGRIPGMYPPLFWMFSAICSGLKVIDT